MNIKEAKEALNALRDHARGEQNPWLLHRNLLQASGTGKMEFSIGSLLDSALKCLLSQPNALPAEPTDELLHTMRVVWMGESFCRGEDINHPEFKRNRSNYANVYAALYKALNPPPKPKTKTKKVWCVGARHVNESRVHVYEKIEHANNGRERMCDDSNYSHISPVYESEVPNV